MYNITCIVCPMGCYLSADDSDGLDNLSVTGNRCSRGVAYAKEEIFAPKRVVTATVSVQPTAMQPSAETQSTTVSLPRIPVKTTSPCLKEKIPALLRDIYNVKVSLPVKAGDIVIAGWNGENFDVIVTRTIG